VPLLQLRDAIAVIGSARIGEGEKSWPEEFESFTDNKTESLLTLSLITCQGKNQCPVN